MAEVQARREAISVPGARPLHEYANLYFCARNPMMFTRVINAGSGNIAVLVIDERILDGGGVVIADGNASSGYTRFARSPGGVSLIDHTRVHGDWSGYMDERAKWEHKRVKCAEVLVPDRVPAEMLVRVLVPKASDVAVVRPDAGGLDVVAAPAVFFNR
jgi:hypothetical protein